MLPVGVEDPALVGVGGAFVRGVGDDADVLLVGYVEAVAVLAGHKKEEKGEGEGKTNIVKESSSYP